MLLSDPGNCALPLLSNPEYSVEPLVCDPPNTVGTPLFITLTEEGAVTSDLWEKGSGLDFRFYTSVDAEYLSNSLVNVQK